MHNALFIKHNYELCIMHYELKKADSHEPAFLLKSKSKNYEKINPLYYSSLAVNCFISLHWLFPGLRF